MDIKLARNYTSEKQENFIMQLYCVTYNKIKFYLIVCM